MGIFSDTFEDNRERLGFDFLFPFSTAAVSGPGSGSPHQTKPMVPCPSCIRMFSGTDALDRHLFDAHRTDDFYVRANGRVLGQVTVIEGGLSSLVVVPLGHQSVEVAIEVDGQRHALWVGQGQRLDAFQELDIDAGVGTVSLDLTCGAIRRRYDIYVSDRPKLDSRGLDARVQEAQLALQVTDGVPDLEGLGPRRSRDDGVFETRYLDGFFEYVLSVAFAREKRWPETSAAMERAWGLLSAFGTLMARSALSLLAFHMDAYAYLVDPRANSRLASAAAFLLPEPRRVTTQGEPETRGIWVDPYHEALIAAAQQGCASRFDDAWRSMQSRDPQYDDAPSSRRKVPLLMARIAAARGEHDVAERAYHELRLMDDPDYGREAEEYLA